MMSEHKAPSIEAARKMGEVGGPAVEEERLAFEAWMSGHCLELRGKWDGRGYVNDSEKNGFFSTSAFHTRQLWAAWRDRAALAIADAALAPESISDTLHDCAHKDTGKVRAAVAYGKREAAE